MADETTGVSAVAEAPASPSPTPPAAPSTSSAVPAESPTSFAEAMAARMGAPATPDPGVSTPATTPPPEATTQAPQTATPPAETAPSTEAKGPIPFERHESILKNARAKTEAEVTERFQQQYAPLVELGNRIEAAPVETIVTLTNGLLQHPVHGPAMVSALARALASRRGQAQPTETATEQEPQADLQTADGTRVYSADQLAKWQTWNHNRLMQEVDQRLQPLQAREQQQIATERATQRQTEAQTRAKQALEPYLAQPEFVEHRAEIAKRQQELVAQGVDPFQAVGLAYTQVLRDVVLPARTAKSQESLVREAVKKATGSTSTPGVAPAQPAGRPESFEKAFAGLAV